MKLAKQIKSLVEDLNANGELETDVEMVITPVLGDDGDCECDDGEECDCGSLGIEEGDYNDTVKNLKARRSERLAEIEDYKKRLSGTDKSNKEMVKRISGSITHLKQVVKFYDKRIASHKDESFNEAEYTDKDALKDHKDLIKKLKGHIETTKKEIESDREMLKDKEEKMKNASDEKGNHGVPSPKQMYKNNIDKIKLRLKESEKWIEKQKEHLSEKEAKHKEAVADVKRIADKKAKNKVA